MVAVYVVVCCGVGIVGGGVSGCDTVVVVGGGGVVCCRLLLASLVLVVVDGVVGSLPVAGVGRGGGVKAVALLEARVWH